jgi:hypothetical protein
MDEDARKLILRIQSEDLADLWTTSVDNNSEIDATIRVYRRQVNLLDRHLENARQASTSQATGEGAGYDIATTAPQILDTDTPILTEDGDVQRVGVDYSRLESPIHQVGGVYSRPKPSFLKTPVVSAIPIYSGTGAQSHQVSDRPVVRLPPPESMTVHQVDKLTRANNEAAIRDQKAEEAREEAVRKEETRKKMNASRPPSRKLTQRQPYPSHARPVEEMSFDDIFDVQDQKKVERMLRVVPGRSISMIHTALKTCHGSFDDAVDLVFRQEADDLGSDSVNLTDSDIESGTAHSNAQSRSTSTQSVKGSTRAVVDRFSTQPKLSSIMIPAAVGREFTLVSTELAATKTTSLKRSADHFTPPGGPSSKKHTSITIKKESDGEPAQPATKGSIRDQVEDLLQSTRLLSSPTPRVESLGSRYDGRGISGAPPPPPPVHHQKIDTRFNGQRSGPKLDSRAARAARAAPSGSPPPPPPSGPRGFEGGTRGRRRR